MVLLLSGDDPDNSEAYVTMDLQELEGSFVPIREKPGYKDMQETTMNLAGKTIRVKIYTLQSEDGVTIVNTFSPDVPLDGMVRSVRNGETGYSIIDFNKN